MNLNRTERLALLVSLLGDTAKQEALNGLEGESLVRLNNALQDFDEYPPTPDEIDLVVSDFEESFQLAMASVNLVEKELNDDASAGPRIYEGRVEEPFEAEYEPDLKFLQVESTGNTVADLNRLHPYQVASVLKSEAPPIIALVVRKTDLFARREND